MKSIVRILVKIKFKKKAKSQIKYVDNKQKNCVNY